MRIIVEALPDPQVAEDSSSEGSIERSDPSQQEKHYRYVTQPAHKDQAVHGMDVEGRFTETEGFDQGQVNESYTRMEEHDPSNRGNHARDNSCNDGDDIGEIAQRCVGALDQPGHRKGGEESEERAPGGKPQTIYQKRVKGGIQIGFGKICQSQRTGNTRWCGFQTVPDEHAERRQHEVEDQHCDTNQNQRVGMRFLPSHENRGELQPDANLARSRQEGGVAVD
jgi:hypothetical protein